MSKAELEKCDGLAVIILRLDPDEATDPLGEYRVMLTSSIARVDDGGPSDLVVPRGGDGVAL
jgi:hypothetical protein